MRVIAFSHSAVFSEFSPLSAARCILQQTRLVRRGTVGLGRSGVIFAFTPPLLQCEDSHAFPLLSFDEVHFGKFASYYIQRQYYFDVHPPLAKMLFGLAGWFVGYDGHFLFENIGDNYAENNVPYVGLRVLPAVFGSLTIPVVYAIMKEAGYSTIIATFSAILILFGTSLISVS